MKFSLMHFLYQYFFFARCFPDAFFFQLKLARWDDDIAVADAAASATVWVEQAKGRKKRVYEENEDLNDWILLWWYFFHLLLLLYLSSRFHLPFYFITWLWGKIKQEWRKAAVSTSATTKRKKMKGKNIFIKLAKKFSFTFS